jgi:putative endonuclease
VRPGPPTGGANGARGRWGEDLAARWYRQQGYSVLDRNWQCREGELDLVAGRDRLIVFCEVKTRASDRYGIPAEAVGWRKQQRLRRLAAIWLATHDHPPVQLRFDVACILGTRLEVIQAAF